VELPPGATYQVIRVPVKKVICMSTTHIAYIEAIGETGSVAGVSGRNNICNEYIRNHPEIPDIGYEQGLNWEKIIEINPDIVLMYGVKGDVVHYEKKLNELGIKTIYVAEYLEETPLAKLEWIKLIGLLFGKYENACSVFEESDSLYCSLRYKAAEVAERPVVLSGFPWKDTWYAAGGKSYLSTLIRDAGGEYLWSGDTTADVYAFDLEAVCIQAYAADLWINAGTVQSSREIESYDSRLASLPPFKAGKVYSNNLRMNETGGNDYFETGVTEPHLILEDLLYIFHPELNPGHQLKYYRKIE
ncbi:MAG: ABC transporter substrate-binding protein, partial [Bacteroidota bacterium]